MGFKFRKSINLGGGFKINLSKSGIGYSWGVKGYRVTKDANGGTRHTVSLPGTGISYSHSTSTNRKVTSNQVKNSNNSPISPDSNHYNTTDIVNGNVADVVSDGLEEMIASANKSLAVNKYSTIGLIASLVLACAYPIFFLTAIICAICKIFVMMNGTIDLEYTIDDDQRKIINDRMNPLKGIAKSKKIWRVTQSSSVIDSKYSAGANTTISRVISTPSTKVPFPFKSNEEAVCFKCGKETLIFLPDKFFLIQNGKVGALNYSDLTTRVSTTRFIESQSVPSDAKVVDKTWKYVNKSGGPDKRFKDNKQIPVCQYGELFIRSNNGAINTELMFSNTNIQ